MTELQQEMKKYKILYHGDDDVYTDTFTNLKAAEDFVWNMAEDNIRSNLKDLIRNDVEECFEIIEVEE